MRITHRSMCDPEYLDCVYVCMCKSMCALKQQAHTQKHTHIHTHRPVIIGVSGGLGPAEMPGAG